MSSRFDLPRYHVWTNDSLAEVVLPGGSQWNADEWKLPRETPGLAESAFRIRWRTPLGNGTVLTDAANDRLMEACKRVVWYWLTESTAKRLRKYNAVKNIQVSLFKLIRYMTDNGHVDFSFLNKDSCKKYFKFLSNTITKEQPDTISYQLSRRPRAVGSIVGYVTVIATIHSARFALRAAGLGAPDDEDPLDGYSPISIAEKLAISASIPVQEIDDETFALIVNHALEVIKSPEATELIEITNRLAEYRIPGVRNGSGIFADISWVPQFGDKIGPEGFRLEQAFRRQIGRLVGAASLVLQALTAIRPSELAGLEYASDVDDPDDCYPVEIGCVTVGQTFDGMFEIFKLKGFVYKMKAVPEPAEWVLGLRPTGAKYYPPTVEAVEIIAKLFHSARIVDGDSHLFVQIKSDLSVAQIYSDWLRDWQFKVILEATHGRTLECPTATPRVWRKSFARYMFRINPSLLPAISNHFQHVSMATTESAYIKPNIGTLDSWTNTAAEQAGSFISEIIAGKLSVVGPVREALDRIIAFAGPRLDNLDEASKLGVCIEVAQRQRLSLFEAHFGFCVFRGDGANCLLPNEVRVSPALGRRTPDVCRSCKNFAVAVHHRGFWEKRRRGLLALRESMAPSDQLAYAVAHRLEACELVLSWLGDANVANE